MVAEKHTAVTVILPKGGAGERTLVTVTDILRNQVGEGQNEGVGYRVEEVSARNLGKGAILSNEGKRRET